MEEPAAKMSKTDKDGPNETGPFSSPWHFSDAVIFVEGRKFHVHRSTLSMWSPVFERMFTSEFKEKSSGQIELPGKSAKEIEILLKLIYFKDKQKSVTINNENFEFLLKLSDEYQMQVVTEICADFMTTTLNKDNCFHFCEVADRYNLKEVKITCIDQAKLIVLPGIERNQNFNKMNFDTKYEILTQRIKSLENVLNSLSSRCVELVKLSRRFSNSISDSAIQGLENYTKKRDEIMLDSYIYKYQGL